MPSYSKSTFDLGSVKKTTDTNNFKIADFRRDLHIKSQREKHSSRKHNRHGSHDRFIHRNAVTIDTSRGRSNIDVVRMAIRDLHFKEFPFGRKDMNCDIHWNAGSFDEASEMNSGAINKFPGMGEVCTKANLFKTLDQMRDLFPNEYDFYPRTWYLPQEFELFNYEVKKLHEKKVKPRPTYIVKPDCGSQGEGIYLLRDPNDYSINTFGKCHVVQEYLSNVYLINNYKFDLRVYVVLKSIDPLEIYICKEGLARFSTVPYEPPSHKNMHETFMHLTNYSLNKKSNTFHRTEREDDGSKRTLSSVLRRIGINCHDTDKVWQSIERVVCKTIIAILPELKVEYQATIGINKSGLKCFQILGFDILLLDNLKPILLEVNSSPSLSVDGEVEVSPGVFEYVISAVDEMVKRPLVKDAMLLMVPPHKLRYCRKLKKKRKKIRSPNGTIRPEPIHHQRTHIVIIKADESDEEKREEDVTEKMSQMNQALDFDRDETKQDIKVKNDTSTTEVFGEKSEEETDDEGNGDEMSIYHKMKSRFDKKSCLKEIYPAMYDEDYEYLRIMERVGHIFLAFLGVKSSLRIGPTGFRTFTRKCRLQRKGLTNAAVDILYIDMQRKWDHLNPERTSGLGFQGFFDACLEIARRKFSAPSKLEMLENLMDYCESSLAQLSEAERRSPNLPRLHFRRLGLAYRPTISTMPSRSNTMEEETIEDLQEKSKREKCVRQVQDFLRKHRRNMYQSSIELTRSTLITPDLKG